MEKNMLDILKSFDSASSAKTPTKVDSSGMLSILKRFDLVESTNEGLDKQQKSVDQLSATFEPKTVKVLGSKTDPKNPMAGKLVGGCEESIETDEGRAGKALGGKIGRNLGRKYGSKVGAAAGGLAGLATSELTGPEGEAIGGKIGQTLGDKFGPSFGQWAGSKIGDKGEDALNALRRKKVAEGDIAEDLVSKVRRSLDDYLKSVEDSHNKPDLDIIKKKRIDRDLGKRPKEDHELIAKASPAPPELVIPECSFPVKSFTFEDGNICEVHGDEFSGFEIHRGNRVLPSKFRTLDEAMLALELFNARNKQQQQFEEESQDYLDEN